MEGVKPIPSIIGFLRGYFTDAGRLAARNLIWLIILTGLTQLISFGNMLILTNGLGKEQFGILAFALAVNSLLVSIGACGAAAFVLREGAQHPESLDETTASYTIATTLLSCIVVAIAVGIAWLSAADIAEKYALTLLALAAIPGAANFRPFFDVHHRQRQSAGIVLLTELLAFAALLLLFATDRIGIALVSALIIAKCVLATSIHVGIYHFLIERIRWTFSFQNLKHLLRSGPPQMVDQLLAIAPLTTGIFFVRWFDSPEEVGSYGLAQQLALAHLMLGAVAIRVLWPHVAGPMGRNAFFLRKLLWFCSGFFLLMLLAGWGGVFLVVYGFVSVEFRSSMSPALILIIASSVYFLSAICTAYLYGVRWEAAILYINLFSFAVFVACMTLIAGQGPVLTAIAVSVMYIIRFALLFSASSALPAPHKGGCQKLEITQPLD